MPLPPVPDPSTAASTLLYNALAQTDVNMQFHRLLNLDTSNLPPSGIPPTINPPVNQWLHDWDADLKQWTATQPRFADLANNLTPAQQRAIQAVGTILNGIWQGSIIRGSYLDTLDNIRPPQADLNINHFKLINVANPLNPGDAVNLGYMDNLLLGLNPKTAVRVVATTRVSGIMQGLPVIDGIQTEEGDRVLVTLFMGIDSFQNGIYIASANPWQRATDTPLTAAALNRAYCNVLEGNVHAGTGWIQLSVLTDPIGDTQTVDFEIFWQITPIGGGGGIIPGRGLDVEGNTLNVLGTANRIAVNGTVDIDPAYAGQSSITTLGDIATGQWQASVIAPNFGGTGHANTGTLTLETASLVVQVSGGGAPPVPPLVFNIAGNTILNVPQVGTLATLAGAEVFQNKRINKRVQKIASASKPIINTDLLDVFYITNLSTPINTMSDELSGSPTDSEELEFWITDNGAIAGQPLAWGPKFDASASLPLPNNTSPGRWLYVRFIYSVEKSKWVLTVSVQSIPL